MLRTTRSQVTAILVGILLLATSSVILTYLRTQDHDSDHIALALVGRQRELVQQIALTSIAYPQTGELGELIKTFQDNMILLGAGGTAGIVDLPADLPLDEDPALADHLNVVAGTWLTFRDDALILNELPVSDSNYVSAVQAVQADIAPLLGALDQISERLNGHMNDDLLALKRAQTAFIAFASALLVFGILLVRLRIVRPADALAAHRRQVGASSSPLYLPDEVYADEVGALLASFDSMRSELESVRAATASQPDPKIDLLTSAFELSQEIVGTLELGQLVTLVTTRAETLLEAHSAALCLVEPGGNFLELVSVDGEVTAHITYPQPPTKPAPTLQVIGPVASTEQAQPDLCADCLFFQACRDRNALRVPLEVRNENIGSLCVVRDDTRPFAKNEHRALSLLASSAAIAITNARLTEHSQLQVQQAAVLAERQRLAAELHDNLAQTLSYLNLRAERAREKVAKAGQADALAEIDGISLATDTAYGQVRNVLSQLSATVEAGDSSGQNLLDFIDDYQNTTGIRVETNLEEQALADLEPLALKQATYIVREALTNVSRHAQAHAAKFSVTRVGDAVCFRVQDDGAGFDPDQIDGREHLGLAIMRTRAERCGGTLRVESELGKGTTIMAIFPRKATASESWVN